MGLLFASQWWWGLKPVACDSGTIYGCAIADVPWVIAGLVGVAVLLLLFRLGLALRERWTGAPAPAPVKNEVPLSRRADAVEPGRPLQPPPTPPEKKQTQKQTPLQLRFADTPDLGATDFSTSQVQGDFGEMLTDAILAHEGWKKFASKFGGGRGIDGLFVREVRGGGGFEALAVETKTNLAHYDPSSMSDAKLERDIGALYAEGAFGRSVNEATARELIRGLKSGPPFFRKELWRHDLSSGVTTVTQLGPGGELRGGTARSHGRLMAALAIALKQIDREGRYFGQKPVDPLDA
jgi:hypothetical protein